MVSLHTIPMEQDQCLYFPLNFLETTTTKKSYQGENTILLKGYTQTFITLKRMIAKHVYLKRGPAIRNTLML